MRGYEKGRITQVEYVNAQVANKQN
jgi:hypothetical protein